MHLECECPSCGCLLQYRFPGIGTALHCMACGTLLTLPHYGAPVTDFTPNQPIGSGPAPPRKKRHVLQPAFIHSWGLLLFNAIMLSVSTAITPDSPGVAAWGSIVQPLCLFAAVAIAILCTIIQIIGSVVHLIRSLSRPEAVVMRRFQVFTVSCSCLQFLFAALGPDI